MPFIFTYLIKLSFAIAIFYCMYRFALRQLTFYRWNRYFLSGYGLLSLFLPFINIDFLIGQKESKLITSIPSINNVSLADLSALDHNRYWIMDHYPAVLFLVFSLGAAYVILRVILQYRSLLTIRKAAVLIGSDDVELYDVDADICPFSFNNSIYFNSSLHPTDELAKILQHEFVHVKQKHIVDLIIAESLCVINWFNPFVWLLRKAIRQNLEFIADQQVLESGIDAKQYQYLLLKVTGITPLGLTNHFNISSLKKRIAMMNKMRTAKVHLLKFLFVLPLLSLVLVSFRNAAVAGKPVNESKESVILNEHRDTVPPTSIAPPPPPAHPMGVQKKLPPPPPPPMAAPRVLHLEEKDLPADVSSVSVSRQVTVKRKDGKTEIYDMNSVEDMRAYEKKYGNKFPPPPPPMPPVDAVQSTSMNNGTIMLNHRASPGEPLIILDGKEIPSGTDLNHVIEPDKIESISVLKDASARSTYGEKAAHGVIIITSKDGTGGSAVSATAADTKPAVAQFKTGSGQKSGAVTGITIRKKDNSTTTISKDFKGLILLNGKEISTADLNEIDPDTITAVNVIKDATATLKYGKKGENGVIEVTSK